VQELKNYQRKGEEQKEIWHHFADSHLGGVRDPNRHDSATLQAFFQTYGLTTTAAEPKLQLRMASQAGHPLKDQLVQQVKAYQRLGSEQKDAWHSYADLQLGGIRDPARHEANVLQEFIVTHDVPPLSEPATKRMKDSTGAPLGTALQDPMKSNLVQQIKAFQRANQQQKDAWHEYADTHLGGIRDPARHDAAALQDFISAHEVPLVAGGYVGYVANSDPVKDQLVAQVKAFQSANQEQKEMWHEYADTHLGGTRDPARHDVASLQQFFSTDQV